MKRKSNQMDEASVDNDNISASGSTSVPAANDGTKTQKVPDATHGLKFESKLLVLFCIRALGAGYTFELTKEREDLGGKFDDVIFRYQVLDDTLKGKHWRYRYLQAKHKSNELDKIRANDVLQDKDNGDFSLPKYFRSFCKMKARFEDIHDCILCTNIAFDVDDLKKNGIELASLEHQPEDILDFGPQKKTARYKLQFTEAQKIRDKMMNEYSNIQHLAKQLRTSSHNPRAIDLKIEAFNSYHVALISECVIDLTTKKFHVDFVNEAAHQSDGAKLLRQTISDLVKSDDWKNWNFNLSNNFGKVQSAAEVSNALPLKATTEDVDDFFDKLVFVVNMPNQIEFKNILQTQDVYKYYPEDECSVQTGSMLTEMSDKFTNKDVGYWLTSEEGKTILLNGVIKLSLQYRDQLENEMGFNEGANMEMASKLRELLAGTNTVERITAPSPTYTAVKVISAIQKLPEYGGSNFLVTTWNRLEDDDEKERWKNILKLKTDSHHLLIIVCDKDRPQHEDDYTDLIVDEQRSNRYNKILAISRDGAAGMVDDIIYSEMSQRFQNTILEKIISFQGAALAVRQLVGNQPDKVIDFKSIKELLILKTAINIASFDASEFEESLYIKRRMTVSFNEQFESKLAERLNYTIDELHRQCRISSQGEIKWIVEDNDRDTIWTQIKNITEEGMSPDIIEDNQLIDVDEREKEQQIVMISGVAGTGKSTILSHYYKKMKTIKPDYWIIRINLVEHYLALLEFVTSSKLEGIVHFLVKHLHVVEHESPFSRSLLRHRLQTGDRIVFMFDGFDEISNLYQQKVIELMKMLTEKKTIKLYVTTRPHTLNELQLQLSQLAYHLQNLAEENQINYLVKYWEINLQHVQMKNKSNIIQKFAQTLAHRVSETLKDGERSFIGVPLQCRILAECYLSGLQKMIENKSLVEYQALEQQQFNLHSLYERLMATKRRVFREEKANTSACNPIGLYAMDVLIEKIESHLTKLAVETLVLKMENTDVLWLPQLLYDQSSSEKSKEESKLTELGVKFGLILFRENEEIPVQFLHRTYAEYLFARYLHRAMAINDCDSNQLFNEAAVCDLIVNEVLVEGNYGGVRLFLNSMLNKTKYQAKPLPTRLQKLARSLAQHIESIPQSDKPNALTIALPNQNLFNVLFDCLNGTLDENEMKRIVKSAFRKNRIRLTSFLYSRNNEQLKRVLSYYDDSHCIDIWRIVGELLNEPIKEHYPLESYQRIWNTQEAKQIVKTALDFMDKHQTTLSDISNPTRSRFSALHVAVALLHFFIFNKYYNCLLSQVLHLLSSIYTNDCEFTKLLTFTLRMQDYNNDNWAYPLNNGVEKTLDIVQQLSRPKVMEGLCHLALITDVFEKYYQPFIPGEVETFRSPTRMTAFHWAAYDGDGQLVDVQLDPEDDFTPLYVAAARHNKETCHKILSLKHSRIVYGLRRHIVEEKGFIHTAMWDAILFRNFKMFQIILEAVQTFLRPHDLIALLKSEKPKDAFRTTLLVAIASSSILALKDGKQLFEIIAKVLLQDGNREGYANINDLVFHERASVVKIFNYIDEETFQAMVTVNGLEHWTNQFLNLDTNWGFRLLSAIITRFTSNQRRQLVDIITLNTRWSRFHSCENVSYLESWFDKELSDKDFNCLDTILKSLEHNGIERLIFSNNSRDCIRAMLIQKTKLISTPSKYFFANDYLKLEKRVWENGPAVMQELFTSPFTQKSLVRHWTNILPFYFGENSNRYFGQLVSSVMLLHPEKHGTKRIRVSLWSKYLDSFDYDGNKVEKVGQFLKYVSAKLGKRAVRRIVLHRDCMGVILLGAELQQDKELVKTLLTYLSFEDRVCVDHLVTGYSFSSRRYQRDPAAEPCRCQPMNSCHCWH